MKRFAFLFWLFTLAAGCIVEDRPVGTGGTGGDVGTGGTGGDEGPCGTCEDPTPVCNLLNNQCVACTEGQVEYCTAQGLACNTELFRCACATDANCTAIDAAKCDLETNACVPCDSRDQCDDAEGLPGVDNECDDDGVCVDCTPETEGDTCPDNNSCDPRTRICTTTEVGSVDVCEPCVADSECGDDGEEADAFRCVPMYYPNQDTRFPNELTGFCLKSIELGGGCTNPFRIPRTRTSLSGADPDEYCAINENLATCPAVRDLIEDMDCDPMNGDADCQQPSGLCRELPGMTNNCTYFCASIIECLENDPEDRPGSTCGTGGAGGAGGKYCGG